MCAVSAQLEIQLVADSNTKLIKLIISNEYDGISNGTSADAFVMSIWKLGEQFANMYPMQFASY